MTDVKVVSVDPNTIGVQLQKSNRKFTHRTRTHSFWKKDLLLPFRWTTSKEVANRKYGCGMHDSLWLPDTFQNFDSFE